MERGEEKRRGKEGRIKGEAEGRGRGEMRRIENSR